MISFCQKNLLSSKTDFKVLKHLKLVIRHCTKLSKGKVIMKSSREILGQVIIFLNVNFELDLVVIQKCLNLLHDDLDPNSKELRPINQSIKYCNRRILYPILEAFINL